MSVSVRELEPQDRFRWDPLWLGYQDFYSVAIEPEATEQTWQRMLSREEPVFGLVALDGERVVGFAHYLLHRSTWMLRDTCYLQDLFVARDARRAGIGRALVEAVYRAADERGAGQVYWLTHHTNLEARRLYDTLAVNAGFIVYERFADTPER